MVGRGRIGGNWAKVLFFSREESVSLRACEGHVESRIVAVTVLIIQVWELVAFRLEAKSFRLTPPWTTILAPAMVPTTNARHD